MAVLKKFYKYWMKFVNILGEVNSRVVFTIIYFIVFGMFALLRKIVLLVRNKRSEHLVKSFWSEERHQDSTLDILRRQF